MNLIHLQLAKSMTCLQYFSVSGACQLQTIYEELIAERLSTRHIIVTLFSLSVYICASRLGMLPVTPKTTNHIG